jgi:subtilisin-like proprotein convertase family protein
VAAGRLKAQADVAFFYPLVARQQHKRAFTPNDPLFAGQWHLKNTGQSGGTSGVDANVRPAWDADVTGDVNTVIGVVDDGLQHAHPDLAPNYRSSYSYDFNFNDADPAPANGDGHGTSAAGVAASRGGNGVGVSGAAPFAGLAGLRLIAAATTDQQEANALAHQRQNIDVYSNSWGPVDDGLTLDAPGPLTLAALADGAATGRGGLGNVYTWAAGNGRENNDNTNYDGYANSRYTIAVGAIDHTGRQAYYSEPGAPILVTAHSDGGGAGITTTDLTGTPGYNGLTDTSYTNQFGGTSSSTPLVAGVVALMLDANPNLTWRDVQHVLVRSARTNDPADAGWRLNAAGHEVNHKYGFGAVDAGAAVALARTWQTAAAEVSATTGAVNVNTPLPDNTGAGVSSPAVIADTIRAESVEVVLSATHAARGNLRVVLTSPGGTQSVLAERHSDTADDYANWVFTSTHHWDEIAQGTWTLTVTDQAGGNVGTFNNWKLNVYGTRASVAVHYVNVGNGQLATGRDFGSRDVAPPTGDVLDVTPDPRPGPVDAVSFAFNEAVTGFTVSDLSLTRDGGGNLLPGLSSSPSLASSDGGVTWTLTGIGALTGPAGAYQLTLTALNSGIVDAAGNALAGDASDAWTVVPADTSPPSVTDVFVSGTSWSNSFLSFLGAPGGQGDAAAGFRLTAAGHADELPWTNVNAFSVRFSEHVNVAADDLVVRGVRTATYPAGAFLYDRATFTATWRLTLAGELRDKLMLDLDADAGTGVTDAAGNPPSTASGPTPRRRARRRRPRSPAATAPPAATSASASTSCPATSTATAPSSATT